MHQMTLQIANACVLPYFVRSCIRSVYLGCRLARDICRFQDRCSLICPVEQSVQAVITIAQFIAALL